MRDRKNNITLDVESALALMQEIYNDVVENRNDCTEKKISLVKLQGVLLKQSSGGGKGVPMGKLELSDEDRELLDKMINDTPDGKKDNYSL